MRYDYVGKLREMKREVIEGIADEDEMIELIDKYIEDYFNELDKHCARIKEQYFKEMCGGDRYYEMYLGSKLGDKIGFTKESD